MIDKNSPNNPDVEFGEDGLPQAFRLFSVGENHFTNEGTRKSFTMTSDDLDGIIEWYNLKKLKLPFDADHFLSHVAREARVSEAELAGAAPYKNGMGTLGYLALERRGDAIWAVDCEWSPTGKIMLKQGQYRYHSPVIEGLSDEPRNPRVTSVALTNNPALENVSRIALSENQSTLKPSITTKENPMNQDPEKKPEDKKPEELNNVADGGGDTPETQIATLTKQVEDLTAERDALKKENEELKDALKEAVGEGDGTVIELNDAAGRKAAGKTIAGLRSRVGALELSDRKNKTNNMLRDALADGRISAAEADYWRGRAEKPNFDVIELSDNLKAKKPGTIPVAKLSPAITSDRIELTDAERRMAKQSGISEEAYLASKKDLAARNQSE